MCDRKLRLFEVVRSETGLGSEALEAGLEHVEQGVEVTRMRFPGLARGMRCCSLKAASEIDVG